MMQEKVSKSAALRAAAIRKQPEEGGGEASKCTPLPHKSNIYDAISLLFTLHGIHSQLFR